MLLTDGSWMITPLLSVANAATGFETCMASGIAVLLQAVLLVQV